MQRFLFFLLIMGLSGWTQIAFASSNTSSYILCGKPSASRDSLVTSSGETVQLTTQVLPTERPKKSEPDLDQNLCVLVDEMQADNKLKINPFAVSPEKAQSGTWSVVQCGDVALRPDGSHALVNNDKMIDLTLPEGTVVQKNSVYCAYGNVLPSKNPLNGRLQWTVEKFSWEGIKSSGVTIGN